MHRIFTTILCIFCGIVAGVTTERAIADGEPTQRPGTITKAIKPAQPPPPKTIEERLAALEKRVEDLENGEIKDLLKDQQEDEAREKRVDARLAALEKARQGDNRGDAAAAPASGARGSGPLTVRAPFIVQDGSGETIFQVGIASENNQPELVLGDRDGARARLGVTQSGGASLGFYDSTGAMHLVMAGNPALSGFRLGGKGNSVEMRINSTGARLHISNARLHISNSGDHAVVTLESRNEHGHFTLGDVVGNTTVEAATLRDSGVGIVRVGPDMGGTSGAMSGGGVVVLRAISGRKAN